MTKKVFDFLSSFGMMLAGVCLVFIFSVSFYKTNNIKLPQSGERNWLGGDVEQHILPVSHPAVPLAKNKNEFKDNLTAVSALVVDDRTDTVLWEKNSDEVRSLASITKLMSALVLLDLPMKWGTTTEITSDDDLDSSHAIQAGDKLTAKELWQVALIGSSNSAINALVRTSGLDEKEFVEKMNEKAKTLRLSSLKFSDPTGLDSGNRGSAGDIIRLLKVALQQDKIYSTLQIGEYYTKPLNSKRERRVWSTDWLLTGWIPSRFKPVQIAGKTGYISDSGYNFVVRLEDKEKRAVRVLILGAASNEARFSEARDLADWAFKNYLWPGDEGYNELAE
jgi:D-alanyl-D-alanine endopeptidase (penicillin-binding protein 7)